MSLPPEQPETSGPPPSALSKELGSRPFSFYPPIRNFSHNEWNFIRETWAEMLVVNRESGDEVWIPRRMLGKVSSVDEPFPIVGLNKELEYRAGSVWPYRPKLLEMPRKPGAPLDTVDATDPGPIPTGKSVGSSAERRVARMVGVTMLVAIAAIFIVLAIYRGDGIFGNRVILQTSDQEYLSLKAGDDYFAVVQRLGEPKADRWRDQSQELAFRILEYPERSYSVILFGADRASATYIGAMDHNWRPIHSVPAGRGVDSTALLRNLPRF
jgi:hypothetical protein